MPLTTPSSLLRLEGLALFLLAVAAFRGLGGGWWTFFGLLLLPDLSLLGYLAGPHIGARVYNAGHSLLSPALLGLVATTVGWPAGLSFAVIWVAHIGMDRAAGYGLKYPSGFHDTHLSTGPVIRRPEAPPAAAH